MFKHILVPLDGSTLAEAVFRRLIPLAIALKSEITLIHIIEKNAPQAIHGERHLTKFDEAEDYLQEIAKKFIPFEIHFKIHVHETEVNDIARSIIDHSDELTPDLVFMTAHGSGGLRDIIVGSIAQQVIAMGRLPVVLIRPQQKKPGEILLFNNILVGLDGNIEHEVGLQVATKLAKQINARLHLLTVINTLTTLGGKEAATGMLLPAATKLMLEMAEESACEQLQSHAEKLINDGLNVTCIIKRGEPAVKIIQAAVEIDADLIILGTHRKSGLDAFWAGSVAPKIPSKTNIPLLFVPFVETNSSRE